MSGRFFAPLAQLIERLTCNEHVESLNLSGSSMGGGTARGGHLACTEDSSRV